MSNVKKFVKVMTMDGMLANPTSPKIARKLLDNGKAIVYNKVPFTIKLTVPTLNVK